MQSCTTLERKAANSFYHWQVNFLKTTNFGKNIITNTCGTIVSVFHNGLFYKRIYFSLCRLNTVNISLLHTFRASLGVTFVVAYFVTCSITTLISTFTNYCHPFTLHVNGFVFNSE